MENEELLTGQDATNKAEENSENLAKKTDSMPSIQQVMYNFEQKFREISGDIPHHISLPVLRRINGKYYYAVFVYFYTDRVFAWMYSDIETGEVLSYFNTQDIDSAFVAYLENPLPEDKCKYKSNSIMGMCNSMLKPIAEDIVKDEDKAVNIYALARYMKRLCYWVPLELISVYTLLCNIPMPSLTSNLEGKDEIKLSQKYLQPVTTGMDKKSKKNTWKEAIGMYPTLYTILDKTAPAASSVGRAAAVGKSVFYLFTSYEAAAWFALHLDACHFADGTPLVAEIKTESLLRIIVALEVSGTQFVALGVDAKESTLEVVVSDVSLTINEFCDWFHVKERFFKEIEEEERRAEGKTFNMMAPAYEVTDGRNIKKDRTKESFLPEDIRNADLLYIVGDTYTSMPLIERGDTMIICTEINLAHLIGRSKNQDNGMHTTIFIWPKASFKENFAVMQYVNGYKGFRANNSDTVYTYSDIFGTAKVPVRDAMYGIYNGAVKFEIIRFCQYLGCEYRPEVKEKLLRATQVMINALLETNPLFVPAIVTRDGEHLSWEDIPDMKVDEISASIVSVVMDGKKCVPYYTDYGEFERSGLPNQIPGCILIPMGLDAIKKLGFDWALIKQSFIEGGLFWDLNKELI